jgi:hypothetical protein
MGDLASGFNQRGIVLCPRKGPLIMQGPHHRAGKLTDLLDRKGVITKPVEVDYLKLIPGVSN